MDVVDHGKLNITKHNLIEGFVSHSCSWCNQGCTNTYEMRDLALCRSPSVSPVCLRRCSLRLSFLFLAVLFVPPVAGKPNEDDNE
ncbi:unnamed protein product [Trifolium pratense]|uniref:Uncharacterized protein n=1 Tax=Trifolium pratense TaxID=57577 RepID=A0ACB0JRT0_TRIPR|nr:unnamed protein product [Trifolium pratense]